MNSAELKEGALVYLPAGVRLLQFEDNRRAPVRYRDIQKPTSVLFLLAGMKYCDVIYGGERWTVERRDVYPMKTGEKNE